MTAIAPASRAMMDLLASVQGEPKSYENHVQKEVSSIELKTLPLTIKAPPQALVVYEASNGKCYNCNDHLPEDVYTFCDKDCERIYNHDMEEGVLTPHFLCDDCGIWMNPIRGEWNNFCERCELNNEYEEEEEEEYYDDSQHLTVAQLYRQMWPQVKSHPHEVSVATDAVQELLDTVNKAHGTTMKAYHAQYLFNYIADHGQLLLKNSKLAAVIEQKIKEFEALEVVRAFYKLDKVFERLRGMIAEIQGKNE
jgi:hypothetical protein